MVGRGGVDPKNKGKTCQKTKIKHAKMKAKNMQKNNVGKTHAKKTKIKNMPKMKVKQTGVQKMIFFLS